MTVEAFDITVAPLLTDKAGEGKASTVVKALEERHFLGATDLANAVKHAGEWARSAEGPAMVVLATDGIATFGTKETGDLVRALGAWPATAVLHVLAIGSVLDSAAAEAIAEAGKGRVITLPLNTAWEINAKAAVDELLRPRGADYQAYDEAAQWIEPRKFPDVMPGTELVAFSRRKAGATAQVGVTAGKGSELRASETPLEAPEFAALLEREAYRAQLVLLEKQENETTDPTKRSELRKQRVDISVKHRVMCPLTSMLVLETEEDIERYGIERRATAEIMVIGKKGIELKKPPKDVPAAAQARRERARNQGKVRRSRTSGAFDFDFEDVELANIFRTIAVVGQFNVIIDPQVARAKMVVALKEVFPLDALFLVARIQELRVKRVKWEEGSTTTTYAIGRPDRIEKGYETANSRTIQLKYSKAEDVAAILAKGLGKDVNVGVERDARTNRLLLRGTEEVLSKVQDLIHDLDSGVPREAGTGAPAGTRAAIPERPDGAGSNGLAPHRASGNREKDSTSRFGEASADSPISADTDLDPGRSQHDSVRSGGSRPDSTASEDLDLEGVAPGHEVRQRGPGRAGNARTGRGGDTGSAPDVEPIDAVDHYVERPRGGRSDKHLPQRPAWTRQADIRPNAAAVDKLRKAVKADPLDRAGRNQLAVALSQAGENRELLAQALDWQPCDPDNPMVYEFVGDAYSRLHDSANALRAYTSIAEVSPGDSGLVNRAGFLALRAGEFEMAATLFRFAIERRPDHANNYRGLALALWAAGKHEEAAKALADTLGREFDDRYHDVKRILREELSYVLGAWLEADPAAKTKVQPFVDRWRANPSYRDALRITLHWETDANDVDLHVVDPNGEECFYSHKVNASGLQLYEDLTQGLGPECTIVPPGHLQKGVYHVGVNYYSPGPMGVSRGVVVIQRPGVKGKPALQIETFCLLPDLQGGKDMRHLAVVETQGQ